MVTPSAHGGSGESAGDMGLVHHMTWCHQEVVVLMNEACHKIDRRSLYKEYGLRSVHRRCTGVSVASYRNFTGFNASMAL